MFVAAAAVSGAGLVMEAIAEVSAVAAGDDVANDVVVRLEVSE